MGNDSTDKIVASLRTWIASAPAGAKVPSSRSLTAEYAASPVTVQNAMRKLAALGLIEARPGVGTFVRKARSIQPADFGWQTSALGTSQAHASLLSSTQRTIASDAIGMHSGYPSPALLPERLVRSALVRASRTTAVMTRSPSAGLPELQAWFANELAAFVPTGIAPPTARDALITAGSQSGLSSIFRAVVGTGQPLLIESPTYWGAIVAAKQAGVILVPIPTGLHGPDPDDINRAFVRSGARAFHAQPTFANPTGFTWSPEVRTATLKAVRRHGAFLIEDDWAHDLGIDADPHPLAALDDEGRVIYLRSLTKSVSPALRVAAVIVRGPARERILADRAAESMYVSGLLQVAALDVVTQPAWRSHLRGFRQQLRARRDLLLTNLTQYAPSVRVDGVPEGGLNLWLRLPEATDVDQVARNCELRGLIVAPGTEWFPAEPSGPFIRLNYSNEEPDRFPAAARTLADALAVANQ